MIASVQTFSRPNNTLAYTANDVVNSSVPILLSWLGLENNQGIINKVRLTTNNANCSARFRLHLYSQQIATINDREQNTVLYSNLDNYVGSIDLPACRTEGIGSNGAYSFSLDAVAYDTLNGARIYGVLQTLDSWTPVANQEFKIEITVIENV